MVTRNVFDEQRAQARALMATEAFERSAQERKKIECASLIKRHLASPRLRLRGITGASDEFLLAAIVQNLKKLVRFLTRGPPTHTAVLA